MKQSKNDKNAKLTVQNQPKNKIPNKEMSNKKNESPKGNKQKGKENETKKKNVNESENKTKNTNEHKNQNQKKNVNENQVNVNTNKKDNSNKNNISSESAQTNVKSTKQFLKNFSGRSEIIGKDGIKGIMLTSEQKKNNILNKSNSQQNYLPPIKSKQLSNLSKSNSLPTYKQELIHDPVNSPSKIDDWRRYPNVVPVSNQINKNSLNYIYDHIQNHNIYQDRSYVPHTYKEYTQQMNEYKSIKFGGVGDNMGTPDWSRRFMKFQKMNLYGTKIIADHLRKINHNRKNPQEEREIELKKQYEESTRFKIHKYGKGVMLNKVREQKKLESQRKRMEEEIKRGEEMIKKEEETVIINENITNVEKEYTEIREITKDNIDTIKDTRESMRESNRNQYIRNINKLKESLIQGF